MYRFRLNTLYGPSRSLFISMNLVSLSLALTHDAKLSGTSSTKSKSFLSSLNGMSDFCFTLRILAAFVFVSLIAYFDGNTLSSLFLLCNAIHHVIKSVSNANSQPLLRKSAE